MIFRFTFSSEQPARLELISNLVNAELVDMESVANAGRANGRELIRQVKFIRRRIRQAQTELSKKSLELGVFGLGLLEDGDIGVGVFP